MVGDDRANASVGEGKANAWEGKASGAKEGEGSYGA